MNRRFWLGVAISILLVAFLFYKIDLGRLADTVRQANLFHLLSAVPILVLTLVIRAWRWQYLVKSVKSVPLLRLISATTIGAMSDMILPARGGDVVRASVLGQKEELSKMTLLGTIIIERILDIFTIFLIALPVFALITFSSDSNAVAASLRLAVGTIATICLLAVVALVLLMWRGEQMDRMLEHCLRFLPNRWRAGAKNTINNLTTGLRTLKQGRHVAYVVLLSFALWSTFALSNYIILGSFALRLPFYASFLFLIFQVLGVTLPSSPGFIGTYHAAVLAAFTLFNVSKELALSVAIAMHAAFFVPFILLGLYFLWKENLTFGTVQKLKKDQKGTDPVA